MELSTSEVIGKEAMLQDQLALSTLSFFSERTDSRGPPWGNDRHLGGIRGYNRHLGDIHEAMTGTGGPPQALTGT